MRLLCAKVRCVLKSDAKIEITITTTNLIIELNVLLAALIVAFPAQSLRI